MGGVTRGITEAVICLPRFHRPAPGSGSSLGPGRRSLCGGGCHVGQHDPADDLAKRAEPPGSERRTPPRYAGSTALASTSDEAAAGYNLSAD